jgi:signal transduction histidine kinase
LSDVPGLGQDEVKKRILRLFRYGQIGRCVNSVTHDLNNYLGAIMAYAELVGLELPNEGNAYRMLSEIIKAVRRSSDLVNNLTSVARRERPATTLVDPGQMVANVLDLRRYDFNVAQVRIELVVADDLPILAVDRPKIEQCIIYLITNALENLEDVESGRHMRVAAGKTEDGFELSVWDSGAPVPMGEQEQIFEPFYTTKGEEHLGLGLPLALEAAQLHDGTINYGPDRGFVLSLPAQSRTAQRYREAS